MDVARVQAAGVQAGCDTADRGGDTSCVVRMGATPDVLSRRGRHELCCPDGGSRSDDISSSDDISTSAYSHMSASVATFDMHPECFDHFFPTCYASLYCKYKICRSDL